MATIDNERLPRCSTPIGAAVLGDYWTATLPHAEEEAVEQHLLACDACSARLRDMIGLAEGVRELARWGRLRLVVNDTFLKRVAEDGAHVREYAPPPGGSINCTAGAEDSLIVGRLAADLSGADRVDLCICDERGLEQRRLQDIPFRGGIGSVTFHESTAFMKAAPTFRMIVRLVAVDAAGERLIGEYTFNHTRTLPGPGAW